MYLGVGKSRYATSALDFHFIACNKSITNAVRITHKSAPQEGLLSATLTRLKASLISLLLSTQTLYTKGRSNAPNPPLSLIQPTLSPTSA